MTVGAAEAGIVGALDLLCERLVLAEADLNALDRAIGDGDHGGNMARAARSLQAMRGELDGLPAGEVLRRIGKAIVMSAGGASGPLYGTLLLEMGKSLPAEPTPSDWAAAFMAGVAGAGRRGRSAEGEKTMLDVLAPAARALEARSADDGAGAIRAMRDAARAGFDAQRPLRATKGRAAYVGERSIGQDDPGAASSLLAIVALAEAYLENCE